MTQRTSPPPPPHKRAASAGVGGAIPTVARSALALLLLAVVGLTLLSQPAAAQTVQPFRWVDVTPSGVANARDLYVGEGSSGALRVSLDPAPTAQVTAQVSITSGGSHATVSGGPLTFTSSSHTDKTVTVSGTEDTATTELDTVVVQIALTSSDSRYNGRNYTQRVRVVDNDTPITIQLIGSTTVDTTEGGNEGYRVWFRSSRRMPIKMATGELQVDFTATEGDFIGARLGVLPTDYDVYYRLKTPDVGSQLGYILMYSRDDNKRPRGLAIHGSAGSPVYLSGCPNDPTRGGQFHHARFGAGGGGCGMGRGGASGARPAGRRPPEGSSSPHL